MGYAEDYVKRLQQIRALEVAGIAVPEPASKSELANMILQRARADTPPPGPVGAPEKKKGGPMSFALNVVDKLSRPLYSVAEAADVAFNEEDNDLGSILEGAKRGFKGEDQTSFIDVLQHQHMNEIKDSDEYKRILRDYGQAEADWYENTQKKFIEKNDIGAVAGGTLADFALDPLNLVPISIATSPIRAAVRGVKAVRGTEKAAEVLEPVEEVVRETATSGQPEAVSATRSVAPGQPVEQLPEEPINASNFVLKMGQQLRAKQDTPTSVVGAPNEQELPRVSGKFGSNRRPPVKTIEGQPVKALYGEEAASVAEGLREQQGRYASLKDVFNRDLRPQDYEHLQKTRNITETAQIVDQVAKGKLPAVDFITNKNIEPLPPVARKLTDDSVAATVKEIMESIPDPVKAKAAGKQPRHPVLNAPSQSNLSQRLTNAARKAFTAATGQKVTKAAAPKFIPAVYERYIQMLKNAEESLITKGREELNDAFYPRGGIKPDSPYLRLSDVLEALPKQLAQKLILGPRQEDKVLPSVLLKAITGNKTALGKIAHNKELLDAVQNIDWTPLMVKEYATRTIDSANAAHRTVSDAAGFIQQKLAQTASDVDNAKVIDDVVKAGKKEFKDEMPAAKASVGDMLDGLRKMAHPEINVVDEIIERGKNRLANAVFDASKAVDAQAPRIETAAKGIEEITDLPAKEVGVNPALAPVAADNIFGTVLSWIKPNAGYKDLRPLLLKNISVRKSSAATRAHEIIKVFGMVPEKEHMDFWNEVRGFIPPVAHHAEPVKLMQKLLQNMFGESGLAEKFAGNTSLARAGLNVDHLNKHMRIVGIKDFKFSNEVPDPLDPKKTLRIPGEEVLNTWKNYQPKNSEDLRVFTHNMTQAVENAMVEYSTWANLGALYGSKNPFADSIQISGMHPAIDGLHVPRELAPQMGKLARGIDEMFESVSNSSLMRAYDQALRTWKTGVTIYAPSHHIRNMVGDVFMGWLDGLSNPAYYTKAATLLKANHHRYSDIQIGKDPLSQILGEGREAEIIGKIVGQTKERIPKGTRVIATAKVGKKKFPITIDQAYQMAYRHGIFPHAAQIEDLPGTETLMESLANRFPKARKAFQPLGGKGANAVRQLSETREHYARAAHWLYALENTKADSLEDLFQKAGDRVRKYHPDGLDMTPTEKRVLRRLIPFYSWTRKAVPLILEGLVMNPAKIMAYPKIMSAIQEAQGIDSSTSDPWPDDQLFPDWLSSNIIGPTIPFDSAFAKAIARSENEVGYGLVNPGNPATDILEDYGNNPLKGIANSFTPFLKIPAEIATGAQVQTGAPIQDKTEYLDKNIPMLSTVSRLTNGAVGTGLVEGGDLKGKETSAANLTGLINFLTGAGILDTGRYQKSAEFDLRERMRKEREKENGSK
jgi:hypothetical protein